jgi:C-terminal binding protein
MAKPFKVFITDFITEPLDVERQILGEVAEVVALGAKSEVEFGDQLREADAIMMYHFLSIGRTTIQTLERCKLIVRCGAGFDNVDHKFARERKIPVANVPDYGTEDVADTAIGLVLSLARGTHLYNQLCQRGTDTWTYTLASPLRRIRGRVFGVIGVGRIGTAAVLRAKALGFDVVFYDPYVSDGRDKSLGVRRAETIEELLSQSHVVSCHCPLTPETKYIINPSSIELMPRGSILVNTARGGVVDPLAVLKGLESGILSGAAIDVLEQEPPASDHPLVKAWRDPTHPAHDRLILTPHAAFYSEEGLLDMRIKGSQNCLRALSGASIRNVVNA